MLRLGDESRTADFAKVLAQIDELFVGQFVPLSRDLVESFGEDTFRKSGALSAQNAAQHERAANRGESVEKGATVYPLATCAKPDETKRNVEMKMAEVHGNRTHLRRA